MTAEAGSLAAESFPIDDRNRAKRLNQRAHYDRATIYPVLDAAMLCHIAYVIDGQPFCTPTAFWREGDTLYWHGSSASRMLRAQAGGLPVCLTVTHMDGLVLARSGFHSSINYRSVMAFGIAHRLADGAAKRQAMDAFVGRFFPGRPEALRPPTDQEVKATSILSMAIEQASAKIRTGPPADDEADFSWPVWAGVIPLRTVVGDRQDCPRLPAGLTPGGDLADFAPGGAADAAFLASFRRFYGN
jgi:nitroimidazol reductase NimA-like FMN-containing flavoprotein (pyridoxamine 5'-phosphate oxidase superfamily)